MASLPETDSSPASTHAHAQGPTMPVHGTGHGDGADQPGGAAAAPAAGAEIGPTMRAVVPDPARIIPAPQAQIKEIKCMYIDNCDTGSQPRKAISHIFGRNKLCTRSIPQHVWVHYCRKHYQRSRYRNAHEYAKLQADLVQKQIDRVQQWSDENEQAGQPGVVSNWSLSIRKREQRRLEDKTGAGRKRTFGSTRTGNNQNNDSDDDGGGGGGGSGAGPADPDTAELNGTAVPDWVLDKCGAGYDTAAIMAIVQRLKVDIESGVLSQIPDIEILPNIRGDGPDGTKAKAATGAKRKPSTPAGAVAAAAAAHKRSQSMGVAAVRTDHSIASSHQMARRISQPGTYHQHWSPDGSVAGVGGVMGSGGVGGGDSAAPFEKRQRLSAPPPADIPTGAQPSSISYHGSDNRHGYGSGVSSISSVVRNTERTVPMMMPGGGMHHGGSSGSNGGSSGNIHHHHHSHLGMAGPASFDDGEYMYRDGRQSQNLPAMPMMNFGTAPQSSRPTDRPPPGGPPGRRPSMMANLDQVSVPASYLDRRPSPHQRSHSDMAAFQSGGYDSGGGNSDGNSGGHSGGSMRPVQQNSSNGNIPRFSGPADYRYDNFDSQAGYDMTPPPNQYGSGGSRASYYDESEPGHGYAYNFQGTHAPVGPQQHQQQQSQQQQQQSQNQLQQSQHQPRQLTGQMGDADATPHHTPNRSIPTTLRGQGATVAQGGGGYYLPHPLPPLQQQQQENQQQRGQADDGYHHSSPDNNNNSGMHARATFYPGQQTGNIQAGPQSRMSAEEEDPHGQHHHGYPPRHF